MAKSAKKPEIANTSATDGTKASTPKGKGRRSFPAGPAEDAIAFANEIFRIAGGMPVRRVTLFDELGKKPDSGTSRQLVTNANRYGLISGNYNSEHLTLTTIGEKCVADDVSQRERARAIADVAITKVERFNTLYEQVVGNRLPAEAALQDAARSLGVPDSQVAECTDLFVVNLRYAGLLRVLSGVDRVISIDHMVDELPTEAFRERPDHNANLLPQESGSPPLRSSSTAVLRGSDATFEKTCFYVSPIGVEGSETRKHADLFFGSLVQPALQDFPLELVRADQIESPGLITRQIVEYIMRARLVIADLSFHNPNVFYEIALRHMARKPMVQITDVKKTIPFDIKDVRTIVIDNTDIYSLLPNLQVYISQISTQVRSALQSDSDADNPVSAVFPNLKVSLG